MDRATPGYRSRRGDERQPDSRRADKLIVSLLYRTYVLLSIGKPDKFSVDRDTLRYNLVPRFTQAVS